MDKTRMAILELMKALTHFDDMRERQKEIPKSYDEAFDYSRNQLLDALENLMIQMEAEN